MHLVKKGNALALCRLIRISGDRPSALIVDIGFALHRTPCTSLEPAGQHIISNHRPSTLPADDNANESSLAGDAQPQNFESEISTEPRSRRRQTRLSCHDRGSRLPTNISQDVEFMRVAMSLRHSRLQ